MPNYLCSNVGGVKIIFHLNLQLSKHCITKIKMFPKFYQELIKLWVNVSKKEPIGVPEIVKEVLWNNGMILSKNESS